MPRTDELAPGGPAHEPSLPWDPWRPDQVASMLGAVTAPWYVAGGWALDLHRGEQTREHSDLEIAVPAASFGEVRQALAGFQFEVAGEGKLWPVDGPAFATMHQTWVSEAAPDLPAGRVYRLDVFREPARDGCWVCRRDESIMLPYAQLIGRDSAGIPYLLPEMALLFKAKGTRPKDEADFRGMLPLLTLSSRDRLRQLLARVHPGHAWIGAL